MVTKNLQTIRRTTAATILLPSQRCSGACRKSFGQWRPASRAVHGIL